MPRCFSAIAAEPYLASDGEQQRNLAQRFFNDAMNAQGIHIHRKLSRLLPFAYTPRLFQFMPYDVIIGLIPPHRLGGPLTRNLLEPVYAGGPQLQDGAADQACGVRAQPADHLGDLLGRADAGHQQRIGDATRDPW